MVHMESSPTVGAKMKPYYPKLCLLFYLSNILSKTLGEGINLLLKLNYFRLLSSSSTARLKLI